MSDAAYKAGIKKWKKDMGSQGWIGVDLDGTLAHYDGWKGESHVGAPVPKMLARVKAWLAAGVEVRIMTARACQPVRPAVIKKIEEWCLKHVGQVLPITNMKDYAMIEIWDDRAVQVIPNTGLRADGVVDKDDEEE